MRRQHSWILLASVAILWAGLAQAADNIITNGDFSAGLTAWTFFSNGTATASVASGEAKLDFTAAGSNNQLLQAPFALRGGTLYNVSFDARSSDGSDVHVKLIQHGAPFENYGLSQPVALSQRPQHFSFTFVVTAGDKTDARLQFWLNPGAGTVYYIDNVVLVPLLCGNGVVDNGEDCDEDGATATCDADCTFAECGDNVLNLPAGESCDDGNTESADGCDATCQYEPGFGWEINFAEADLAEQTLELAGRNICTLDGPAHANPLVFIGTEEGDLFELPVLFATPVEIEADLTSFLPIEPATYKVLVECRDELKEIDVTIGAAGPRGPQGPPGRMAHLVLAYCGLNGDGDPNLINGSSCMAVCPIGYSVIGGGCSAACGAVTLEKVELGSGLTYFQQSGFGGKALYCEASCAVSDQIAAVNLDGATVWGQAICADVKVARPIKPPPSATGGRTIQLR